MMVSSKIPAMTLAELLAGFDVQGLVPAVEISNIAGNSRDVTPGSAFLAPCE